MSIKESIIKYVNKPVDNILSSQTLYESLLTVLDLYEITSDIYWKNEAKKIVDLIIETQLSDGGFDIGYDFMFGKNLHKSKHKESTTPEVLSIYALYRYGELFGFEDVSDSIDIGVKWILDNVIKISDTKFAIPYAPLTYSKVHITNGVSFALSVLAYYLKFNKDNHEVKKIYNGMVLFMDEELQKNEYGFYWPYFYLNGTKSELLLTNDKIDNYHIGQQLKYHCTAYNNFPTKRNLEIIRKVSTYLTNKITDKGLLAYTEKQGKLSDKIDLWGYSSVVKGLVDAYKITGNKELKVKSEKIIDFIITNSWNGTYFYPILNNDGSVFDGNFYPRSDAWVIHSLAHYIKNTELNSNILDIININYKEIAKNDFCGLENHTLTIRKKIFSNVVSIIKTILKKGA